MSFTKLTTNGFSRRLSCNVSKLQNCITGLTYEYLKISLIPNLTSVRHLKATISVGNVRRRFLCKSSDFRFFKFAMVVGSVSRALSLSINPLRLVRLPTDEGISLRRLPPKHNTLSL